MRKLNPEHLIPLNAFADTYPISIDLVYANSGHADNHFKGLYDENAQILWAHRDIAEVTLLAARIAGHCYGLSFKLNDCLRPVEAQQRMEKYGYHPSLVSKPGMGAHPRAMAIDIELLRGSQLLDMGTAFDFFAPDPERDNPAARDHADFSFDKSKEETAAICSNRNQLESTMLLAARQLGHALLPLPEEWWDFRFTESVWAGYLPVYEKDLLPCQRLIDTDIHAAKAILDGNRPFFMQSLIDQTNRNVETAFAELLQHNLSANENRGVEKPKPPGFQPNFF